MSKFTTCSKCDKEYFYDDVHICEEPLNIRMNNQEEEAAKMITIEVHGSLGYGNHYLNEFEIDKEEWHNMSEMDKDKMIADVAWEHFEHWPKVNGE